MCTYATKYIYGYRIETSLRAIFYAFHCYKIIQIAMNKKSFLAKHKILHQKKIVYVRIMSNLSHVNCMSKSLSAFIASIWAIMKTFCYLPFTSFNEQNISRYSFQSILKVLIPLQVLKSLLWLQRIMVIARANFYRCDVRNEIKTFRRKCININLELLDC